MIDKESASPSLQQTLRVQSRQDSRFDERLCDGHRVTFAKLSQRLERTVKLRIRQQLALLKLLKELCGVRESGQGNEPIKRKALVRKNSPRDRNPDLIWGEILCFKHCGKKLHISIRRSEREKNSDGHRKSAEPTDQFSQSSQSQIRSERMTAVAIRPSRT